MACKLTVRAGGKIILTHIFNLTLHNIINNVFIWQLKISCERDIASYSCGLGHRSTPGRVSMCGQHLETVRLEECVLGIPTQGPARYLVDSRQSLETQISLNWHYYQTHALLLTWAIMGSIFSSDLGFCRKYQFWNLLRIPWLELKNVRSECRREARREREM